MVRKNFNKTLLGAKIAYYRKLQRLEQAELAKSCGYSAAMIGQIEQGKKLPSVPLLVLIATHLKIPVDTLIADCLGDSVKEVRLDGPAACDKSCNCFPGAQ